MHEACQPLVVLFSSHCAHYASHSSDTRHNRMLVVTAKGSLRGCPLPTPPPCPMSRRVLLISCSRICHRVTLRCQWSIAMLSNITTKQYSLQGTTLIMILYQGASECAGHHGPLLYSTSVQAICYKPQAASSHKSGSHQAACRMRYQCPLSPPPAGDHTLTSCHPVQFINTVITSLAS